MVYFNVVIVTMLISAPIRASEPNRTRKKDLFPSDPVFSCQGGSQVVNCGVGGGGGERGGADGVLLGEQNRGMAMEIMLMCDVSVFFFWGIGASEWCRCAVASNSRPDRCPIGARSVPDQCPISARSVPDGFCR